MAEPRAEPGFPLRLKEWLVAQVDSGRYPGLRWEDADKRLFRIPWKHASKQDYRQRQDAALFKAWAVYKGKYHEGLDKADPSAWKTRLRCALNKSADFQEVPERSSLDVPEPYKVYRIVAEDARDADKENGKETPLEPGQPSTSVHPESKASRKPNKARMSSESGQDSVGSSAGSCQASEPHQAEPPDYQIKGFFYNWSPAQFCHHPRPCFTSPSSRYSFSGNINSDSWLHVRIYYSGVLVKEVTTHSAEGCWLTYRPVPAEDECLYGLSSIEQIQLPSTEVLVGKSPMARAVAVLQQLLPHLHRGALLWVAPEGVFMKRQCQGRVYWKGPLAAHEDHPNKLEREKTYQLLDTPQFFRQLRGYLSHGEPPPQFQIHLCFGEEYPAAPGQKLHKFVMAQVEPVFARDLFHHAQRLGPGSLPDLGSCHSEVPENIVRILRELCP